MASPSKQKDPVNITVGRRLRLKRELMGLSQSALGEDLGISRIKVGQYESGQSAVPAAMLYRLSQALKTDISYFFQGDKDTLISPENIQTEPFLTKESISLLRDFEALDSPEIRKKFAAVMERTAKLFLEKKS